MSVAAFLRSRATPIAAIVIVTLAAWRPCLDFYFFSDDFVLVAMAARETVGESLVNHTAGFLTGRMDAYFRPAWHLLFDLVESRCGLEPRGYFAVGVALHLLVALALYALVARATGERWIAALASIAFAVAPGATEAVAWPSASFNVPPCALLLLVSGWSLERWLAQRRTGALVVALAAFALSFTFKEAGYQMAALFAGAAWWRARALRERWREVLIVGGVILAAVLLHYRFLNAIPAGDSLDELLGVAVAVTAAHLRALTGIPGSDRWILTGAAAAIALLLRFGGPRTRFAAVWAVAGLVPYAAKSGASRFAYFFHVPLFLAIALAAVDLVRVRGSIARAAAIVVLGALGAWNAFRLPVELEQYHGWGEECRRARASLVGMDFSSYRSIAVDRLSPILAVSALDVMARDWCGIPQPLRDLHILPKPPFAINFAIELEELTPDVALLTWDDAADVLRPITREDLLGDLILLPAFALRHEVVHSSGAREAIDAMRSGSVDLRRQIVLYEEPTPAFRSNPEARGRVESISKFINHFEVTTTSDAEGFLAIHSIRDITRIRSEVTVDGAAVPILRADGAFNAVRVPAGRHLVRVSFRGKLAKGNRPRVAGLR